MASVLIALGGNVGDVRATFEKATANICGMAQAALATGKIEEAANAIIGISSNARAEALEEAARVCFDSGGRIDHQTLAAMIRALKDKP